MRYDNVSLLRSYGYIAPTELLIFRSYGAMDISLLRSYGCGAPTEQWILKLKLQRSETLIEENYKTIKAPEERNINRRKIIKQ